MVETMMAAYQTQLTAHLRALNPREMEGFIQILLGAYRRDSQVFIVGNGGSAATANHFVCDFGKNAVKGDKRRFRVLSLCDHLEKITALGNDIAFEEIFRQQLINLMRPGDVLIAVSASGNSPNVARACEYFRERGGEIVALLGFDGGRVKGFADVAMVVESDSYERIEDLHLIILHMVVCYFKEHQELLG